MSTELDPLDTGGDPSRVVVIVGQGGVQTDLDLDSLADNEIADAIPHLLADYAAECKDWTVVAAEHWKKGRWDRVDELLNAGFRFFSGSAGRPPDNMALFSLRVMMAHVLLAQARTAPKALVAHAKYDKVAPQTKTKDWYYTEAAVNLNGAEEAIRSAGVSNPNDEPVSLIMGKIILYLARGQPGVAASMVDDLLRRQPHNVIALSAQARLQFARRSHEQALQTYQTLLHVKPDMKPDPRIGLGLCAWVLGDRGRATLAWKRSLELDTESWVALLLLGLASLNTAREPATTREERIRLEAEGVSFVQRAFKLNNRCSAAALALSTATGQSGQLALASKLAERAVQYADTKRHAVLANAERGRLGFVSGDTADAAPFIAAVKAEDAAGVNIMAELTLGQIAIKNGNLREALNFIEQTAKRLNGQGPIEYTVLHACLLAYPHPGMPADEIARNRKTSRQMLSDVHSAVASAETDEDKAKLRGVAEDVDLFLDLATLWHGESVDKAVGAYQTASHIFRDTNTEGEDGQANLDVRQIRTSSNLGSLFLLQGNVDSAEREYQLALEKLASETGQDSEILKTELAYNLARAYEENGDSVKASQWYRDVLRQHPEHMESKVRQAMLAAASGRNLDAHTLLKECLRADETNVTLRSSYTYFLISIGSYKEALAFTSATLKHERNDPFTFCALGWLHFTLGREAKSSSDLAERPKQYLRSAEAYERALTLDPRSAMAAQGLAIALAEDTLSSPGSANAADEGKIRQKLASQALGIFSRINDCLLDGSGNINMGHCHFTRGDEEKAIQAYEAGLSASKTRSVPILLYLARAWYAWATRESNISGMSKALNYCQQAMHIQPSDRAILYNIAMIQQKSAELLFSLEPSKRTSEEVQVAIGQAQQAVNTFRALANDKSGNLPYDADLADQRARYGDGLLRRAPEQVSRQEAYESEAQARVEEARKLRAAEQERIRAAEEQRRAELAAKAEEIAAVRRQAQEEARKWAEEEAARTAEDEARRANNAEKRRRKVKDEVLSGEEGAEGVKPTRKRKAGAKKGGKKKRNKSEISSDEEPEAMLSDGDGDEVPRQRKGEGGSGDEEEDTVEAAAQRKQDTLALLRAKAQKKKAAKPIPEPKGKQFKSKEIISESEDESDDEISAPPTQDPSTNGDGTPAAADGEPTVTAGTSVLSDAGDAGDDAPVDTTADAEKEMELGVEAVPTATGASGVEADDGGMNDEVHTKSTMNL